MLVLTTVEATASHIDPTDRPLQMLASAYEQHNGALTRYLDLLGAVTDATDPHLQEFSARLTAA